MMMSNIPFIAILVTICVRVSTTTSKCLLRNDCGTASNLLGDVTIPCLDPHDPHKLNDDDAIETLKNVCPSFFKDGDVNPDVCCDLDQIYSMEENFRVPMQLGMSRCPSCLYNWKINFCELICSPRQSEFVDVVDSTELTDGRIRVDAVDYHVTSRYAKSMFMSCNDVQGLSNGTYLLDIMCGGWGWSQCTPQRWLDFLGTSVENDGQSPFQINYKISNDTEYDDDGDIFAMDTDTYQCYEVPFGGDTACARTDCDYTNHGHVHVSSISALIGFILISLIV